MSHDYALLKKVLQVVLLNYRNILAKISFAILFAIIYADSIAIHTAILQKV